MRGDRRRHGRRPDPWRCRALVQGYRSRAVFKLIEIDRRDRLLASGRTVVDLGAAPGGWSQYAAERVGKTGRVVAVDRQPMKPITGVQFVHGDLADSGVLAHCLRLVQPGQCDLVLADVAPNLSGVPDVDQARARALAELALEAAGRLLHPRGTLLVKVFQGGDCDGFRVRLRQRFRRVAARKPAASSSASREFYLLARCPASPWPPVADSML